ncbi:MAG TPA: hypothetical protein VMW69_15390, partial [Spirochaetia bacterium]|nr:hypothetical protein [Spirochaetia bacterium]
SGKGAQSGPGASLTSELLREMVFTAQLRVRIPRALARRFEEKLKRTAHGYSPRSGREIIDWLKERLLIPLSEWRALLEAIEGEGGPEQAEIEKATAERIIGICLPGSAGFIAPLEQRSRIERALGGAQPEGLAELLREWIAFSGPIPVQELESLFGVGKARGSIPAALFEEVLNRLSAERVLVLGPLLEGSEETEVCDAENLEHLLAFIRRESSIIVETRPIEELVPFLAQWQGIAPMPDDERRVDGDPAANERGPAYPMRPTDSKESELTTLLERLFGYPAKAGLWESELLPARLPSYREHWLDRLLRDSELEWVGLGKEKLGFRFHSDAELFATPSPHAGDPIVEGAASFHEATARYTYWDLQGRSGLPAGEFTRALWAAVWKGRITSESFDAVRRGASSGFRVGEGRPHDGPARRGAYAKWRTQTPLTGSWYLTPTGFASEEAGAEGDLIDELELSKDRVRILLDRYGILFRELLDRELPLLKWGRQFRTLRLMELSGEILCGRYFDRIPGLQFASVAAVERLRKPNFGDPVFWMNATDPASPCGLHLPEWRVWPSRIASSHLVFHGSRIVLVAKRQAAELTILVEPDHPELSRYFGLFNALLERDFEPLKAIRVERVNGKAVRESPYRAALVRFGFDEDFKTFTYRGRSRT